MIVVYGATSSGKSLVAENIAVALAKKSEKRLIYLATMEAESEAAKQRIDHHRAMRQGKGFVTIEEKKALSEHVPALADSVVLLECISNLVANYMFDGSEAEPATQNRLDELTETILNEIRILDEKCQLVVVTNNVFGTGKNSDPFCDAYMRLLAQVNMSLAEKSECFVEVEAGLPLILKGQLNWLY